MSQPTNTAPIAAQVQALEKEIFEKKQALSKLRQQLPTQGETVKDYTFENGSGTIKLSELFGDKNELMIVHNMGKSCPYCTLWADGINGIAHHLNNRSRLFVASPDSPEVQAEFAASRNWTFDMISHQNNTFSLDMGYATKDNHQLPGVSVFTKAQDGTISRYDKAFFGPGDNYCIMWDLIDLLPSKGTQWAPKYKY